MLFEIDAQDGQDSGRFNPRCQVRIGYAVIPAVGDALWPVATK
jgi:hypothetical protein